MIKSIFLVASIMFSLVAKAQNLDYLKSLKSISTTDKVVQVTKEIVSESQNRLRLFKAKDIPEYSMFVVQYVPADITDAQIEQGKLDIEDQFVIFQFKYWNEGENKELKIEGKKKYVFSDVRGPFLDLFPFWQKNVDPTAEKESLSKRGNSFKNNFSFSGSNGKWKIRG